MAIRPAEKHGDDDDRVRDVLAADAASDDTTRALVSQSDSAASNGSGGISGIAACGRKRGASPGVDVKKHDTKHQGLPSEGIKLESNLEGEAKGVYDATFYATITMLVKPDRTIDYEARQIHTTSDGDTVLVYFKETSIIESPTRNRFVGETTFQTGSKKLGWLNQVKARHDGEYNPVAGENDFRVYGKR